MGQERTRIACAAAKPTLGEMAFVSIFQWARRQGAWQVIQVRSVAVSVDEKTGAEAPVSISNLSEGQIRKCD